MALIHKVASEPIPRTVTVPGRPLAFGNQRDLACVWFLAMPEHPSKVHLVFTGHETPPGRYLGTALFYDGAIVVHAFVED